MSEKELLNVQKILEEAKKDNSLFCDIKIDELLNTLQKTENEYLENKTIKTLTKENYNIIKKLNINKADTADILNRLSNYRYIENVCELKRGKYIRWIRLYEKNPETFERKELQEVFLTQGAVFLDANFTTFGTNILCKSSRGNKYFKFRFEDCIIFQILSSDEQLLLMAKEVSGIS